MQGLTRLLGLVVVTLFTSPALLAEDVKVCVDNHPPYQMQRQDGTWTGENIVVLEALFEATKYRLVFSPDIPFQRCLLLIAQGDMDVMPGLIYTNERNQFAHLLKYDDGQAAAFFTLPGHTINQFSDLNGLIVAYQRGTRYFSAFDNAPAEILTKVEVGSIEAGLAMVQKQRVDAMLCSVEVCNQVLIEQPELSAIQQSAYVEYTGTASHLAISRKSTVLSSPAAIETKVKTMLDNGEFQALIQQFRKEYAHLYDSDTP